MNDTLKVAGRIGAELGAAKAENEAMRILLRESYSELLVMKTEVGFRGKTLELIDRIDAFLSRQPEPTDTYTAVEMATAAAQGFRDGQAAVEPAPAQDEPVAKTVPIPADIARAIAWGEHWDVLEAIGSLRCLLADPEGDDDIAFPDSPAQTEQQLAGWRRVVERLIANVEILDKRPRPMCRDCADCNGICDSGLDCDIRGLVEEARAMLAAPIAQTAPQGYVLLPKQCPSWLEDAYDDQCEKDKWHGDGLYLPAYDAMVAALSAPRGDA